MPAIEGPWEEYPTRAPVVSHPAMVNTWDKAFAPTIEPVVPPHRLSGQSRRVAGAEHKRPLTTLLTIGLKG
jgi:hypothetical protein